MPLPDLTVPTITVTAWPDPVIDAVGHDPRSTYVEMFWLSILGPSTTWLLRRLVSGLDRHPDGYELPLAQTASALGLGNKGGRHSPFVRSLARCCQFGAATFPGSTGLAVRRRLPPLTRRRSSGCRPSCRTRTATGSRPTCAPPRLDAASAGPPPRPQPRRARPRPRGDRAPAPPLALPPGSRSGGRLWARDRQRSRARSPPSPPHHPRRAAKPRRRHRSDGANGFL